MHLDFTPSHYRYAAYDAITDWYEFFRQEDEKSDAWLASKRGSEFLAERRQAAQFERDRAGADDAYRNASLRQSGANARTQANASIQSASIAAKARLKEAKMTIDANYRQFRERLNELEIPTLHLDAWYRQQQVGLAKANLELEARGPRNAFQYAGAMRQVSGTPNLPASLAAMARNQPLAAFEGQSGKPEAMSFSDLASKYGFGDGAGAGGAAGVPQSDLDREKAALAAMQTVVDRGPQGMAPGVYESMTDYEKAIFGSGLEKLGYDANDWLQRRERAGIGQGSVRAA